MQSAQDECHRYTGCERREGTSSCSIRVRAWVVRQPSAAPPDAYGDWALNPVFASCRRAKALGYAGEARLRGLYRM